jgi:hypothetical protein
MRSPNATPGQTLTVVVLGGGSLPWESIPATRGRLQHRLPQTWNFSTDGVSCDERKTSDYRG